MNLLSQTLAMADQRNAAVCHYSVPTYVLEHQLQKDLPPARALIFITSW